MQWFLQQWRTPGQLHDLLEIATSWCQVNIGFSVSFLNDPNEKAPHFESAFLKTIRDFMKHMNDRLEMHKDHVPPPQQINNQHLMDTMVEKIECNKKVTLMNCTLECV